MLKAIKARWLKWRLEAGILFGLVILAAAWMVAVFEKRQSPSLPVLHCHMTVARSTSGAHGFSLGAAVRLNGYVIGSVARLKLTGAVDGGQTVEFDMQLNSEFMKRIPVDSVVVIAYDPWRGSFIDIFPGEDSRTVQSGAELRSLPGYPPSRPVKVLERRFPKQRT